MNYMGKLISNFKGFYNEINSATLTGAIDVLIIQRDDGTYVTSPWHVRFGKMGVLRPSEKVVDVEINGEPADIHMKLGEAGEAFFVQEAEETAEVPAYLATSPIPSHLELMEQGIAEMKQQVADGEKNVDASTSTSDHPHHPRTGTLTQDNCDDVVFASEGVGGRVGEEMILTMPRDESRLSLYHSVSNSMEIPNGDEEDDDDENQLDRSSNAATQTDMTGIEADAKAKVRVRATSGDRSSMSSDPPPQAVAAAVDSSLHPTNSSTTLTFENENEHDETATPAIPMTSSSSPITQAAERQKKRRRKRADLLKTLAKSKSESSVSSSMADTVNSEDRMDGNEEDEMLEDEIIFDMDLSDNEQDKVAVSLTSVARTVSMPIIEAKKAMTEEWANTHYASTCHPFSDGDLTPIVSPIGTRPPSPKSDTELDHQKEATSQTALTGDDMEVLDDVKWEWGELPQSTANNDASPTASKDMMKDDSGKPSGGLFKFMRNTKKMRHNPEQEGIYLEDLNLEEMDPEVAALYLYHPSKISGNQMRASKDEDNESGRGASLPQSPVTVGKDDSHTEDLYAPLAQKSSSPDIAMSLCGGLEESEGGDGVVPTDRFLKHLVTFDQFCDKPNLLTDPNLVIRIADKYYNWQVAGPIIISVLAFQRPLPDSATDSLLKQHVPKKQRRRGWFWWGGRASEQPSQQGGAAQQAEDSVVGASKDGSTQSPPSSVPSSIQNSPHKDRKERRRREKSETLSGQDGDLSSGDESDTSERSTKVCRAETQTESNKFKKTLKLSSDDIGRLNLQEGVNEVVFSVTTQYQGTSRCSAYIYLWNWDDKIIVSDIDGTITKSDVLGQVLPMIGKDWSQVGIANLYNLVANNGYRFVYLSARAIGQAKITRDYLRSIRQGELSLPDGPLMLSPSSLISAFHKEVIERKPEEFKISCLRDVVALFPPTRNPLYAGFGNKINDVWAYRAVGIPIARIFTVNHRGELKSEMIANFASSYNKLSDVADHFFPPLVEESTDQGKIHSGNFPNPDEFSTFTYWRDPLPEIELDMSLVVANEKIDKKKAG